jgi:DNA-directed RNA polymerase subunit K/omega
MMKITRKEIDEWFGDNGLKITELRAKAKTLGLKVGIQTRKSEIKKLMELMIDNKVERHTLPVLTKYELAKLLAKRAQEIADGQPITIQNPGTISPKEIAMLEFRSGKSPKRIKRIWPDGRTEVWNVSELRYLF